MTISREAGHPEVGVVLTDHRDLLDERLALWANEGREHGGVVPDTIEGLTSFRGVGPKIANLTLAVGFRQPALAVDIHVHRIANRWGIVAASSPQPASPRT